MDTQARGTRTGPDVESAGQDLTEVRRHRAELLESINALEQALAAPTPGREMPWATVVSAALLDLSDDFRDHVQLTEGTTGLYTRVIRSSPRLAHEVDRLTKEHRMLSELVAELLSFVGLADGPPARNDPTLGDPDEVRDRGTALIGALVRHRQRGADLVYEAYSVDIGGED